MVFVTTLQAIQYSSPCKRYAYERCSWTSI